ncbi:YfjI family protein [Bhargavaea beijingensis]|uniref:DUF3987 domain-containing protein n=1 Tax=Bhargavaea beijingensis TaxID=426756 RepID=A0ABX9ZCC0_9BACL|nr:YfjI family protein [Bhargavaea beijingensis]RSK30974.1 DUF3987 domain-containing protein [Bhargavaea beijingensis]
MVNYMDRLKPEYQEQQQEEIGTFTSPPIPFNAIQLPPFPTRKLTPWVREAVQDISRFTQTPEDAAGGFSFATAGAALQKKVRTEARPGWMETPNVYLMIGMGPGNRKSSIAKSMTEPINIYERNEVERVAPIMRREAAELKAKQRRLETLNAQYAKKGDKESLDQIMTLDYEIGETTISTPERINTNDVTPEKLARLLSENGEKMAILSADGGGTFMSMGGRYDKSNAYSSMDLYLHGHPGDLVIIDRVSGASIKLEEPLLDIGLFVQPENLQNPPAAFKERGLIARFMFFLPNSFVGYRDINPPPRDEEIRARYIRNMIRILEYKGPEIVFKLSPDAWKLHLADTNLNEIERRPGGSLHSILEWANKLDGLLIRLATQLHALDHAETFPAVPEMIPGETMARAIAFKDYLIAHAKKAHGMMNDSSGDSLAEYVMEKIATHKDLKGKETLSRRDIHQVVKEKNGLKMADFVPVLDQLEDMNYLTHDRHGKSKKVYINPLFVQEPDKYIELKDAAAKTAAENLSTTHMRDSRGIEGKAQLTEITTAPTVPDHLRVRGVKSNESIHIDDETGKGTIL